MASKKLAATFRVAGKNVECDSEEIYEISSEDDWEKVEDIREDKKNTSCLLERDIPKKEVGVTINNNDNDNDNKKQTKNEDRNTCIKDVICIDEDDDDNEATISVGQSGVAPNRRYTSFTYTPIPPAYPKENIIVVSNLIPRINRYDLITAFSKYGTIMHIQKNDVFALIAFSTKEEAQNSTLANNLLNICGRKIGVRIRALKKRFREYPSDQVVFIFDLLPNIPDKVIREHFSSCGKIIAMPYYRCRDGVSRVLIFEQPGSLNMALGLNGTYIEQSKIRVKPRGPRAENYIEGRTVVMFNVNGFADQAKSVVVELFSKCGKIVECDMLCNTKKLAMVTFRNEIGVENAMKLSGTVINNIAILLEPYTKAKYYRTKVMAFNIAPGITSLNIADAFKETAVVDKVHFAEGRPFALIEFATTDDFCNAFRLDGEDLGGQNLVLKPFSDKDESFEYILYGREDWIAMWGDRPRRFKIKKRRF